MSTPPSDSADVIPKTLSSITAVVVPSTVVFPCPLIGGLVTVQDEPLFVDGVKVLVAVKALVDVPPKVCALFPLPVKLIAVPPSVALILNLSASTTLSTK